MMTGGSVCGRNLTWSAPGLCPEANSAEMNHDYVMVGWSLRLTSSSNVALIFKHAVQKGLVSAME